MCGIAGIFSPKKVHQQDVQFVKKMNDIQKHRGPDDEGVFSDEYCHLGHRRLAIIDLSKDGHQPFVSDNGRFQLVYNGEIYNYIELRDELKRLGWKFRTKTDTEVLLKAYQQYGLACLSKCNGMFAFALYDRQNRSLFLARDRFGIKPLYYMMRDSTLYFSSEIKALHAVASKKFSLNYQALFDYLVFNRTDIYDETFFNEVKRLPKGSFGIFDIEGLKIEGWWTPERFKRVTDYRMALPEVCATIDEILTSSVTLRLRSDVPVGSCLSGGLDSSILTGILFARNKVADSYATFTASFPDYPVDETKYVTLLNGRYNFRNYQVTPTSEGARAHLKDFVYTNDEPTTGPSFYSQYEVMRLAKDNNVVVLLDGQGGDESFAGYQYFHGFYLSGLLGEKRFASFITEFFRILARQQDKTAYQTLLFQAMRGSVRKKVLFKTAPYIKSDFFCHHINNSRIFNEFFDARDLHTSLIRHFQYKLEHLLRIEDRNSMAFSLETRLPYLDYRLVEYILSISDDYKIKNGETKYLQKEALGKYTIPEILNRRDKIGFGTPSREWMGTPRWNARTEDSARYCEETFSNIFEKRFLKQVPNNEYNYWKINQLAVWHQMFG